MKYWTDFLPNRTNRIKKLGRIKNALDYNLMEAKIKVEHLEAGQVTLENHIVKLALNNNTEEEIKLAIQKAEHWNEAPIQEHIKINNKNKS